MSKRKIVLTLAILLVTAMVAIAPVTWANFTDTETSTGSLATGWQSSVHWATTQTDFQTGEEFFVDAGTSPGNVTLQQTKYFFACQGGGSSNAVYRFNETTLAWEAIASVPAGGSSTFVGAGGGLSYPGTGNYVYCLKGNGTSEFYRYDISTNSWTALTAVPESVTTGGFIRAVQIGASYYLYVFTGGTGFYSYNITAGTWSAALASPGTTGAGASMTWDGNNTLYATLGGSTTTFLSYSLSGNTWTTLTTVVTTSGTVGAGSELAYTNTGTPYVYLTQGNNTTGFYRYNIGTGWSTMASTPAAVNAGGSMRWDGGGFLFALIGSSTAFYRYNIALNSWGLTIAPVSYAVTTGGAYTSGSSQYDYAFTGGTPNYFLAYDKTANSWSSKTPPGYTGAAGACLAYVSTGTGYVYAFEGGNSKNFWKYDVNADSWSSLTQASVAVTNGTNLVWTGGDYIYATFGNTKRFERYSISLNSWTSMANKMGNTNNGGSLAWDRNDYIYAINGGGNGFERYSISGLTWTSLANLPGSVNSGGSLAYPYAAYSASNPLYATRGAGTVAFYKYTVSSNTWSVMANVPSAVGAGGSLCDGEDGYIHCIAGNNTTNHWRYNVTYNTWAEADAMTAFPAATGSGARMSASVTAYTTSGYMTSEVIDNSGICEGGVLTYDGTNIYGTAGDLSTSFRKYNISGNSWSLMTSLPDRAGWGAALCSDKAVYAYIYAFVGNHKNTFLRYDVSLNTWTAMANAPENVWMGGAMVYVDTGTDYIYALTGGTGFYRYDIASGTWSGALSSPGTTGYGASLVYDGTNIYATLGGNTTGFKRYNVAGNSWTDMTVTAVPAPVGAGGGLTYPGTGNYVYCLLGEDTSHLYRYDLSGDSWLQLSSTQASVFQGGCLTAGDSSHLYTYRGRDTVTFWRYTVNPVITDDLWESMTDTPAASYVRLDALVWDHTLPAGTGITYAIKSSNTLFGLTDTLLPWTALTADVNGGLSSAVLSGLGYDRYIQFKITFTTTYINVTPTLSERRIYYYRWY